MYHTLYFITVTSMSAIVIILCFIFPLPEELSHEHFITFLKQAGQIDFARWIWLIKQMFIRNWSHQEWTISNCSSAQQLGWCFVHFLSTQEQICGTKELSHVTSLELSLDTQEYTLGNFGKLCSTSRHIRQKHDSGVQSCNMWNMWSVEFPD